MVIRPQEIQGRIKQPRLLQSQKDRIGALRSSQSARPQALVGFARLFIFVRQASFQATLTAALEDAQDVARLRYLPTGKGIEERQNSLQPGLLSAGLGNLNQTLRRSRFAVALSEVRVLDRKA